MPPVFWVHSIDQVRAIAGHLRQRSEKTIEGLIMDPQVLPDEDLKMYGLKREDVVKLIPYGSPDTVILDGFSEMADWCAEEIDRQGGTEVKNGLEQRKLQAWTPIAKKVTGLIRTFRDIPYHTLFICHDRIVGGKGDEDLQGAEVWPKLPGRDLQKTLMQSVNAMGRMRLLERTVEGPDGKPAQTEDLPRRRVPHAGQHSHEARDAAARSRASQLRAVDRHALERDGEHRDRGAARDRRRQRRRRRRTRARGEGRRGEEAKPQDEEQHGG
jgi:hypothetical protein